MNRTQIIVPLAHREIISIGSDDSWKIATSDCSMTDREDDQVYDLSPGTFR